METLPDRDGEPTGDDVDARTTGRRRWRRAAGALVVAAALAGAVTWFAAPRWLVWRLGADDHAPSVGCLRALGPRVLPAIYDELEGLGTEPAGSLRSHLVRAIAGIRHDEVGDRIGTPRSWEVHAALVPVDEDVAQALSGAYLNEPDGAVRARMLGWLSEHDVTLGVRFFCDVIRHEPDDRAREALVGLIDGCVELVAHPSAPSDERYPWRDLDAAAIEAARGAIWDQLMGCVVPRLRAEAEREGAASLDRDALRATAIEALRRVAGATWRVPRPGAEELKRWLRAHGGSER